MESIWIEDDGRRRAGLAPFVIKDADVKVRLSRPGQAFPDPDGPDRPLTFQDRAQYASLIRRMPGHTAEVDTGVLRVWKGSKHLADAVTFHQAEAVLNRVAGGPVRRREDREPENQAEMEFISRHALRNGLSFREARVDLAKSGQSYRYAKAEGPAEDGLGRPIGGPWARRVKPTGAR
jgi:hypothetical protein